MDEVEILDSNVDEQEAPALPVPEEQPANDEV